MNRPATASGAFDAMLERRMHELAVDGIRFGADRIAAPDKPWWRSMAASGTRAWLDTGDLDEAGKLWCSSFAALTTNNTLLNKEVQKGIYDDVIRAAAAMVRTLPPADQVVEIAFLLNGRHALRLASRFGGRVSVELHTDLAHDLERSVAFARRYYALCPEHFIIKIPFTPAGLLAVRMLRRDGIPVNCTLGFSARQNLFAAALAAPNYVNVFLGRLNAYVADNGLGDGVNIGEKATLASQRIVRAYTRTRTVPTLQIAASMRSGAQIAALAGVDVHTMPTAAAREAEQQAGEVRDRSSDDPAVQLTGEAREAGIDGLWVVGEQEFALASSLERDPPRNPEELVARFAANDFGGLFPTFEGTETAALIEDGKIPSHQRWKARLTRRSCLVDGLLSAAALSAFAKDQAALDGRIRSFLGVDGLPDL